MARAMAAMSYFAKMELSRKKAHTIWETGQNINGMIKN